MEKHTIACVEYHNTLPFIKGLEHQTTDFNYELIKATPSKCAKLFNEKIADVSLVPVAALHEMRDFSILDSYCLGCDGEVYSVALLSNIPLQDIKQIYLDDHSRTSNQLLQILAKEHWNISPEFLTDKGNYNHDSQLLIGDKVFELENNYTYKYDLGTAWKEMTGLPFVFAVWIRNSKVSDEWSNNLIQIFDESFKNKSEWTSIDVNFSKELLYNYLHKHIQYIFDMNKQKALKEFLSRL